MYVLFVQQASLVKKSNGIFSLRKCLAKILFELFIINRCAKQLDVFRLLQLGVFNLSTKCKRSYKKSILSSLD